MIPAHYPYHVGFEWAPPFRVTRIRSVFDSAKQNHHKLTVPDLEALQNDITSLPALQFQEFLQATPLKDDASLNAFLRWDGRLTRESSAAALYEVWSEHIVRALSTRFAGNSRTPVQKLGGRFQDLPPHVVLRLLTRPDRDLFGDSPPAARNQLLSDTLQSARAELAHLLGPDPSRWSWGKLHVVRFRHALDLQSGAKELFDLAPLSRPGDEYTVNATGTPGDSWDQVSGASYREILDTGDWDNSRAVNTPGQSGQPGSPHYSDLMPLWDAGQYFPLLYSRKAIEHETTDRLTLEP
jgi:penicillin G amidase